MRVRSESQGAVTTVILARPEARNAVDRPMADALVRAFQTVDADPNASVAVLWGEGGAFCAGADLKAVAQGRGNRVSEPTGEPQDPTGPMGPTRLTLGKPVIAAIEGPAVAGGLELALWADLRVMAEDAVLGVFCRRWGVPLMDGGTIRLPRIVGHGRAMELILTGRPVHAAEALAIGLVNRVVPKGETRAAAETWAAEIARFPQTCARNDRLSAIAQWGLSVEDALVREYGLALQTMASGEAALGATRFLTGKGRGGDFGDI